MVLDVLGESFNTVFRAELAADKLKLRRLCLQGGPERPALAGANGAECGGREAWMNL